MDADPIQPLGVLRSQERPRFVQALTRGSIAQATTEGVSLTFPRPYESQFAWTRRKAAEVKAERAAYRKAARQRDLFDTELAAIEPWPFAFCLRFRDDAGWHDHQCEDWETEAAFWSISRAHGETTALAHLDKAYNQDRPANGMVLAMGNMAARPQTWILLGILTFSAPEPDLFACFRLLVRRRLLTGGARML